MQILYGRRKPGVLRITVPRVQDLVEGGHACVSVDKGTDDQRCQRSGALLGFMVKTVKIGIDQTHLRGRKALLRNQSGLSF